MPSSFEHWQASNHLLEYWHLFVWQTAGNQSPIRMMASNCFGGVEFDCVTDGWQLMVYQECNRQSSVWTGCIGLNDRMLTASHESERWNLIMYWNGGIWRYDRLLISNHLSEFWHPNTGVEPMAQEAPDYHSVRDGKEKTKQTNLCLSVQRTSALKKYYNSFWLGISHVRYISLDPVSRKWHG